MARTLIKFEEDIGVAEEIGHGRFHLAHSVSGWMYQDMVVEYLKWLSMMAHSRAQCLIWDIYPSHRSDAVEATAAQVKTHLNSVPSDLTGTCQSLDYSVFGSVKVRARGDSTRL